MAIEQQKDPRTKKPFLEASGNVKGVYLNELKVIKTYPGTKGQSWTPTHSINLVIDDDRISLGLFEKTEKRPIPRAKDADGNYHDLAAGAQVSVVIEEGEPYNNKPQYKAVLGDVLILEPAPVKEAAPAAGAQQASYKPKDMTGVRVGHATNVAINALGLASAEEIIAAAKEAHELTERLNAEYKEKNPKASDYDIGASVGQAVLSASRFVDKVSDIEQFARITLDEIVPAVTEFVKNGNVPKEEVKAPAAKPQKGKAKAAPAKSESPSGASDGPSGFDDMDDDIPF